MSGSRTSTPAQRLRRRVGRLPGVQSTYLTLWKAGRELRALLYWGRGALRHRLRPSPAGERFARQRDLGFLPALPQQGGPTAMLRDVGVEYVEGRRGAYVPPQPGLDRVFGDSISLYPPNTGYRLVRNGSHGSGALDLAHETLLAGGVLHSKGIGPRIYDVTTRGDGPEGWIAFAVEHAGADLPPAEDVRVIAAKVSENIGPGGLTVAADGWRDPGNFRCAGRNANGDLESSFVGFDHFRVLDPKGLVNRTLSGGARENLHFGLEFRLRGRRYLYQSVPTVGATGRRDSARRWRFLASMLAEENLKVDGRLVLDVGCNAGMMLAAALADGATWGHGWDRRVVAGHATDLLLALGFTRHSISGAELGPDYPLLDDVPDHLRRKLDGAVVLYLAVRHHIGFVRQLGDIPWAALLYEGGELEPLESLEEELAPLRAVCDFRVAAAANFRDSETGVRPVALLVRE